MMRSKTLLTKTVKTMMMNLAMTFKTQMRKQTKTKITLNLTNSVDKIRMNLARIVIMNWAKTVNKM